MPSSDRKDRPDTRSAASESMLKDAIVMRDVAGGTDQMRDRSTVYLTQHPAETAGDYRVRLNNAVLSPNAVASTVSALAGMVHRQNIAIGEDVPEPIVELLANIDNRGTHLDVFMRDAFADALEAGHVGILVDAPLIPEAVTLTRVQEAALGIRPFWTTYAKESIISWRFDRVNGRQVLEQLVLHEPTIEPDGAFGEQVVDRWRVLRRVGLPESPTIEWELWEDIDDNPTIQAMGTLTNVDEIPFVVIYGGSKTAELESDPPLLDLAHVNIAHYQVHADLRQSLLKACCPILTLMGVDSDEPIKSGPNITLTLPEGADAKYVEHAGRAHADAENRLKDYKHDMSTMGVGMLFPEVRNPETATARRMDKSEQDSALATAARSEQDAIDQLLAITARMLNLEDGGTVTVNRDFDMLTLDAQELLAWFGAEAQGIVSLETVWAILQEGGKLPDGFDPEVEKDRIEASVPPPAPAPVAIPVPVGEVEE